MDPKHERPAGWPALDVEGLLGQLARGGVDFVVIGGIAMVLHGSARLTRDLDIVFGPGDANVERLGAVLTALGARLREVDEDVPFVADAKTLRNAELLTLTTELGWLDVHRRVDGAPDYEELKRRAERMDLGGFSVLVASSPDLVSMKRAAGRAQDLADVEELEAIARLSRRRRG